MFYILIRGSAGDSNKQKETEKNLQQKNIEEEKKLQMLWSENVSVIFFTRSPSSKKKAFYFCIMVFWLPHLKAI